MSPTVEVLARRIRRWEEHPDTETSVMAQIGRRLLAGETLGAEAAAEYGVSTSAPGMVVRDMKRAGYVFRTQRGPGGGNSRVFTLLRRPTFDFDLPPEPPPEARPTPRAVAYQGPASFARAEWTRPPSDRVEDDGRARWPPHLRHDARGVVTMWEYPALGAVLEVRALALTDEGVMVQMVGGGGAWQATITGHVAPGE